MLYNGATAVSSASSAIISSITYGMSCSAMCTVIEAQCLSAWTFSAATSSVTYRCARQWESLSASQCDTAKAQDFILLCECGASHSAAATTMRSTTAPPTTPSPVDYSCGQDLCPSSDALYAKVLGRSGKIDLAPTIDIANDPNKIRFEMSGLRELDSSGNVLGQGGNSKHSFDSFATQDFTFGTVQDSSYGGLACVKVPFSSTLGAGSKIEIEIFLFKVMGTITVGPETFSVTNRTMKFNVKLFDWKWCGDAGIPCTNDDGVGSALELDLQVSSNQQASEKTAGSRIYDMGGDAVMRLSRKVEVDASWQDMPDDGPILTPAGSQKVKVTLKFPRFNSSLLYDPEVTYCQGVSEQCKVTRNTDRYSCMRCCCGICACSNSAPTKDPRHAHKRRTPALAAEQAR